MSELINSAQRRKELLKHMILQLHEGTAPDEVRPQLIRLLGQVPYGEVVEVEQELIAEGLPVAEVLRLCDIHTAALQGAISQEGAKVAPPGHPVHTFQQENLALQWELEQLSKAYDEVAGLADNAETLGALDRIRVRFNALMDVDKHYRRKEYLLFPHLEKHGISGPPTVMWGKHDEARALLRGAFEALATAGTASVEALRALVQTAFRPASDAIGGMIDKEEQILLPMCLDTLEEGEWLEIARQSHEIGFCLFDPTEAWLPEGGAAVPAANPAVGGRIQLPSGSFTAAELQAVLNTIPFDLTFVDADDTVRFFTQGKERIFDRNRAILGRKVQFCHPPASVHVVESILAAFKEGAQDAAAFWLTLKGRFVHIEYFALRDDAGAYLGTLEVSQDLTAKRALQGDRRLLSWQGDAAKEVTRDGAAHD
jgi:DUF438 domain-containing protein